MMRGCIWIQKRLKYRLLLITQKRKWFFKTICALHGDLQIFPFILQSKSSSRQQTDNLWNLHFGRPFLCIRCSRIFNCSVSPVEF
jgi:hypothetical protein